MSVVVDKMDMIEKKIIIGLSIDVFDGNKSVFLIRVGIKEIRAE